MEKEGFGEDFSICSSFCFGGIQGDRKQKTNSILSLVSFVIASGSSNALESILGIRLGHFRYGYSRLDVYVWRISSQSRSAERVLGCQLFGGRKESSPQLRSPPRSGLLDYSVLYFG